MSKLNYEDIFDNSSVELDNLRESNERFNKYFGNDDDEYINSIRESYSNDIELLDNENFNDFKNLINEPVDDYIYDEDFDCLDDEVPF